MGGAGAVRESGGDGDDPGPDRGGPGGAVGAGGEAAIKSALTCSMIAWPRCCDSACTRVNGESVNTA